MSRSFHFNAPLQGDAGAPRAGLAAELEAFPLLSLENRWLGAPRRRRIVRDRDRQRRHRPARQRHADLSVHRDALGLRPALRDPARPSASCCCRSSATATSATTWNGAVSRRRRCASTTSTQVCLPDVQLSHLTLGPRRAPGAHAVGGRCRWQLAYLPGFGLGQRRGPAGLRVRRQRAGDRRHAGRQLAAARLAGAARVGAGHPLQLQLQPAPARVHVGVGDLLRPGRRARPCSRAEHAIAAISVQIRDHLLARRRVGQAAAAGGEIVGQVLRARGRRDRAGHRGVAEDELEEELRPAARSRSRRPRAAAACRARARTARPPRTGASPARRRPTPPPPAAGAPRRRA